MKLDLGYCIGGSGRAKICDFANKKMSVFFVIVEIDENQNVYDVRLE